AIVERDRERACEILAALAAAIDDREDDADPSAAWLRLVADRELHVGPGGTVSVESSLALLLESAIDAGARPRSAPGRAVTTLLDAIPVAERARDLAVAAFNTEVTRARHDPQRADDGQQSSRNLPRFRVERGTRTVASRVIPVRVSFWREEQIVKVAAIHEAATVPERVIRVDLPLIDDL